MAQKLTRALLLISALGLTGFALFPRPVAALEACSDVDDYEWRTDGCCSNGYTNFRLWHCDGMYWRGTATFKCGYPSC